jgi:hypothetical protein
VNLGIWAWLYNWRERKRIRKAIDNEEMESFLVHLPMVKFVFILIPFKSFDPIPLSLDALKGGDISKIYSDGW